jgi:colanic acid biosynthesis glycosyl transferase WcaI
LKIAFLSPFFWPEPISTGKYNTILAEALTASGFEVDFYCSHPIYPEWKPKFENNKHPAVKTIRGGHAIKYSSSQVLKRLTLELWFLFFVLRNAIKFRNRYDLLISVYPPVFFGFVAGFFIPKGRRHVVISHDIQGILANQEGRLFRRSVAKIMRYIEKVVYRKADHIIFLSESMRNYCIDNYGIPISKTSIHYPFEDVSDMSCTNELDIFKDNEKRIVYSGALGEKQAPEKIIKLFVELTKKDPEFKCYVFSSGPKFNELQVENIHTRIIFSDLVPLRNLRELLEKSKLQLIPQEIGTADAVLPSKLPNILTAGAGVVAITDKGNELEYLLKKVNNSMVFHNWDYDVISDAILRCFADQVPCNVDNVMEDVVGLFNVNRLVEELKTLGSK